MSGNESGAPVLVTPSDHVVGYRIVESFGLVRGNTIRARHVGHDIMAVFKHIVGGEIEEYTKLMGESREQSIARMVQEARSRGANAVVTVRFTTSMLMGGAAEILVFGDAVRIEPVSSTVEEPR